MGKVNLYTLGYNHRHHPKLMIEKELSQQSVVLNTEDAIVEFLNAHLKCNVLFQERIYVLAFNCHCGLLGVCELTRGTTDQSAFHVRDMAIALCLMGAYIVIAVHNHPDGVLEISKDDVAITNIMKGMSLLLGFKLDDHLIIGGDGYLSLSVEGYIDEVPVHKRAEGDEDE